MQRGKILYFNVSITSRELQTSRLGLVSAGEANVSVSGGERLGLVSVSSFYVSCPSLYILYVSFRRRVRIAGAGFYVLHATQLIEHAARLLYSLAITEIQTSILFVTVCNNNDNPDQINDIYILQFTRKFHTSSTSPTCTAMEQPSHYPITVSAGYAGVYLATSGSDQISNI